MESIIKATDFTPQIPTHTNRHTQWILCPLRRHSDERKGIYIASAGEASDQNRSVELGIAMYETVYRWRGLSPIVTISIGFRLLRPSLSPPHPSIHPRARTPDRDGEPILISFSPSAAAAAAKPDGWPIGKAAASVTPCLCVCHGESPKLERGSSAKEREATR